MQTKKKGGGRQPRELARPRISRQQKKTNENIQANANKVAELITSSARKQTFGTSLSRDIDAHVRGEDLGIRFDLLDHEESAMCLRRDTYLDHVSSKEYNGGKDDDRKSDTIFSPAFHISRNTGAEIPDGATDFVRFFHHGHQQFQDSWEQTLPLDSPNGQFMEEKDLKVVNNSLSTEDSAMYNTSKLECVDEYGQDHIQADVYMEDEDFEEYDDFDPYFFIKNLPQLSSVVPTFRPVLLPKQTRRCPSTTLVLDLDETLVHSSLEPCADADFTFSVNFDRKEHMVYVRCRPHLKDFLEKVSSLFEIILFTASQSIYAEQLLNVLDPRRKLFRHRVYRESCVFVDGNYLKDLSVLGRDLAKVIIVDNSPQAFGFQVDNGIPIESWFDDRTDNELLLLLPFLESLVGAEDVRPLIARKFNLQAKIAAAVSPLRSISGDPFER